MLGWVFIILGLALFFPSLFTFVKEGEIFLSFLGVFALVSGGVFVVLGGCMTNFARMRGRNRWISIRGKNPPSLH